LLLNRSIVLTMRLSDLIYSIDSGLLKLLAGKSGLAREIKWFAIVEKVSHSEFINQGDLVFITGSGLNDEQSLLELTASILKQKAAGVVFAPGPYINNVSEDIINFCNANDFPAFIMPWDIKISTLTHTIAEFLIFEKSSDGEKLNPILQEILLKSGDTLWSKETHDIIQGNDLFTFPSARVLLFKIYYRKNAPNHINTSEDEPFMEPILKNIDNYINKFLYLKTIPVGFENSQAYILLDKSGNQLNENRMLDDFMSLIKNLNINFPDYKVVIGMGNHYQGVENISKSYNEACCIANIFKQKKQTSTFDFCFSNLRSHRLMFENPNIDSMRNFYLKTLGPLKEYDRIHHDSLLNFLSKYITCNCNINETSAELFMHKNTVIYKLKKIEAILNINTNKNEDILDVWIAFLIKDVFDDQISD